MSVFFGAGRYGEPRATLKCAGDVDDLDNHGWNAFLESLQPMYDGTGYTTPEGCVYKMTTEVLGEGGESTVYVCRKESGDKCSVKAFAVKCIYNVMSDESYSLKLLKKCGAAVDTVPAANVTDRRRQRPAVRIAMPIFDGTMDELFRGGAFSMAQTVDVMKQTVKICDDLKTAGLSYTDMKPQNILYYACGVAEADGTVPIKIRLGDLGSIAKIDDKYQSNTTLSPPDFTYDPAVAEAFMLWSCGATMCILMCCGHGRSDEDTHKLTAPLYWSVMKDNEGSKEEQRAQLVGLVQGIFEGGGYSSELCKHFMGTTTEVTKSTFSDVLSALDAALEKLRLSES